jgi:hypothetical protein
VSNLDEVGISEWEDRKSKNVVVPVAFACQTIHHGISRNLKHITTITCVFGGGGYRIPDMVTFQAIAPVRLPLEETGLPVERDLTLRYRQKPYINRELFVDYVRTGFQPDFADLRRNEKLSSEEAVE